MPIHMAIGFLPFVARKPDMSILRHIQQARYPMTRDGEFIAMMASLMAIGALAIDMMLPALGAIANDLDVRSANDRQLIVAVYLIASAPGALIFGPLTDRFGRRPILALILVLFGAISILAAFPPNFESLLAARIAQGFISAGFSVVATSIVRDHYSGDTMARVLSTIFIVFMMLPVLAPSLGQFVLYVANWHAIFLIFASTTAALAVWVFFRLPETLADEDRIPIDGASLVRTWHMVVFDRIGSLYMIASGLMAAGLFGFINSAQQLFEVHFKAPDIFPIAFAGIATGVALANFVNSRIVEKFGARRVSHTALLFYVIIAGFHWLVHAWVDEIVIFAVLLALTVSMIGLTGANFGSIAMQPFAHAAGAAAAFQSFGRMLVGGLLGALIGQGFDGGTGPLTLGFFLCGVAALCIVLLAEKGRLFQRRYPPKP